MSTVIKMDKMTLMARGHEIWLEASKSKARDLEITLSYGHNMKQDGCPEQNRLTPTVFGSGGKKLQPELKQVNEHFSLKFGCDSPGYYIPVVDMSPVVLTNTKEKSYQQGPKSMYKDAVYAGAFHQMAKTIILMGRAGRYQPEHVHGILDIVPDRPSLEAGKTVRLTVLYEGKPLPGIEIKAVSQKEGTDMATVKTDKNGVALMPVPASGRWMFLARHRDPSKGVPDQYDEAVFVATLTLEAKKR